MDKSVTDDPLIRAANKYTFPIYIQNDNQRPELIATGVGVRIFGKPYLSTAAHVFHEITNAKRLIYTSKSNLDASCNLIELDGKAIFTKAEGDRSDAFDLCLIDGSTFEGKIDFIDASRFAGGDSFGETAIQFLQGFPISRNKPDKSINPKTSTIKSTLLTVGLKLNNNLDFRKFGKNKTTHIGFNYGKGFDEKGSVDLIHPKGMSGCGIWNLPNKEKPENVVLIGVFIEYYSKDGVCFATRAKYLRNLIEKSGMAE